MRKQKGGYSVGTVVGGFITVGIFLVLLLMQFNVIKLWLFNKFNKKLKINIRLIYKLKIFLKWRKVEL